MEVSKKACLILLIAWAIGIAFCRFGPPRIRDRGTCGPSSLYAAIQAIGGSENESEITGRFAQQGTPTTLGEMQAVARSVGYQAHCRQMTMDALQAERPVGVLHVDTTHFVALIAVKRTGVEVIDPLFVGRASRQFWTSADLSARWDGNILVLTQ